MEDGRTELEVQASKETPFQRWIKEHPRWFGLAVLLVGATLLWYSAIAPVHYAEAGSHVDIWTRGTSWGCLICLFGLTLTIGGLRALTAIQNVRSDSTATIVGFVLCLGCMLVGIALLKVYLRRNGFEA